jgi:hypothetical protein
MSAEGSRKMKDIKKRREEMMNTIKQNEELKRKSVLEIYHKKLKKAENLKEE